MNRQKLFFILTSLLVISSFAMAGQTRKTDPATGIVSWQTQSNGVALSLTQILPDQARAFYVNRGFTLEQAEAFAISCVYMAVLRNEKAPSTIHFTLRNWSIVTVEKSRPPREIKDWMRQLKKEGVKPSALIAFRWAQFPPEQSYEPGGDWNQGMLSMGLPAGSAFDLIARWDSEKKIYEAKLEGVHCAK